MLMAIFTMVDPPLVYNIILGALCTFKVVAFFYHQKIKFPVRKEIGEVKGDQQASHR